MGSASSHPWDGQSLSAQCAGAPFQKTRSQSSAVEQVPPMAPRLETALGFVLQLRLVPRAQRSRCGTRCRRRAAAVRQALSPANCAAHRHAPPVHTPPRPHRRRATTDVPLCRGAPGGRLRQVQQMDLCSPPLLATAQHAAPRARLRGTRAAADPPSRSPPRLSRVLASQGLQSAPRRRPCSPHDSTAPPLRNDGSGPNAVNAGPPAHWATALQKLTAGGVCSG